MALNMKSLTQALAKTAAVIEKHVQSTVQEVTGPKPLQDYELVEQIGSGGPALAWKLYSGRPRNKAEHAHNPEVCVWVLDKKLLSETRQRIGITKAAEDAFLEVVRADAGQMLKLRHPGVLRVVQALDESKTAMAMVTEPIFASVANVLGNLENVSKTPKELRGLELGLLEIKHGLLQLTETLSFLHNNAQLVHRAISPESVFITSTGSWKFGGFGFAATVEQTAAEAGAGASFLYPEYDVDEVVMPLQPPLNYTAPELTRSNGNPGSCSDIFSLGCLIYHLLSREPLVLCKNNLRAYKAKVQYLASASFSKIPPELVHDLKRMLSPAELSRPTASEFTGSPFFREDTRLRALRFLDHMLERDNIQKSDFLKALSGMWTEFDPRVLRYKVLPPLCLELRNVVMLPMVLPMVLTIAESQEKADFESSTLPALLPVLSSATGESLLLLVKHAALLINKVTSEHLSTSVVPMLVRAYDDPDARMQEEVLKRTIGIAKQIDYQILKQSILPRIHGLALKTTIAAVRVNALLCLGELVPRLDKNSFKEVLQTLQRCTAVDHSAPTLMCTLGVADASYKQFGVEFAAEHLLPLLTPLLTAQQLNLQQFTKYMQFVKEILREIEEKRGLKDGEAAKEGISMNGGPPSTKGNSWDADYWSSGVSKTQAISSATKPEQVAAIFSSATTTPAESSIFSSTTKPEKPVSPDFSTPNARPLNERTPTPTISGGMPLDWEWPPKAGTGTVGASTTQSFSSGAPDVSSSFGDDFDPFADWPPRNSSGNAVYGVASSLSSSSSSSINSINNNKNHNNNGIATKLDDFFSSPGQSQPPLKLAPPPPPAASSGMRGRGRSSHSLRGGIGAYSRASLKQQQDLLQ
ncbi:hypothetical protein SELMODRAFT_165698 [Selaginella moellendorffii]|uniref:Protein kinase domain-containing protein n=1 Tax=Selaginella moellendorffii TaxID=88036 RepID=D8QW17_SELML|nr:SCY1-like protein 2 [Selaginella moellendorffii]EFJ36554.1 hypothetical protein SELMODRAFT_165698 [Selaginella moellendorffii]|eukprot:XP_002963091.1 SCY1-like protein 2 [Selaginella moellendorffii]